MALFPGLPRWAGTEKVKPIWILQKQETVSGSGISWAICKSAPCSRQITMPTPHYSVFYRPDALPAAQPTASKHWRQAAVLQQLPHKSKNVSWLLQTKEKKAIYSDNSLNPGIRYRSSVDSALDIYIHNRLTALCPGLPGWVGTRKVKPIWILLKQETVSGSEILWAICKSAPCSRQKTTPAPHRSVFYRPDALPAAQPTASKH